MKTAADVLISLQLIMEASSVDFQQCLKKYLPRNPANASGRTAWEIQTAEVFDISKTYHKIISK